MVSVSSDPRTDEQLVAAVNQGDERAFAALYHRYRDWVVSLSVRCTGHEEDACDVLQETFKYLLGKRPLKLTASMTTFLYPVVKNLAIAARKKRARLGRSIDGGGGAESEGTDIPAPPEPPAPGTQRAQLAEVIAALPDAQREVVLMRFVDDMSLEEIGVALAIPTGTVKSRLHNALAVLRDDPRTRRYFEAG